jgi:hypothetical protein
MSISRFLAMLVLMLALATSACAPASSLASPQSVTHAPAGQTPTEYVPTAPPVTPTYEGCAYVWGSQDLPELSRQLNASLQALSADLTGLAYAFGEDCVYGDGHSTFSAMETDFRVGIKVKTVRDEGALGDWIRKVMTIIQALPPDKLAGARPGRVDFDFKQPDPAEVLVSVPIEKYRAEADSLRGADLLHLFYKP